MNRQLILYYRPALALILGALWIVGFYTPYIAPYIYSTRWYISIILCVLAMPTVLKYLKRTSDTASMLIVALLLCMLLSWTYSYAPEYTLLRAASAAILILTAYFYSRSIVRSEEDIIRIFFLFLFLYAVLIIIYFYSAATSDYAFASDRLQASEYFKATGGGNMLVSAGLMLLWYYKYCKKTHKIPVIALFCVLIAALIATKSRVPIAGALILWPMAWAILKGGKLTIGSIVVMFALALSSIVVFTNPDYVKFLRLDTGERGFEEFDITTGRMERWEFLLEQSQESPVVGHGFGTSRYARLYYLLGDGHEISWSVDINTTETQRLAHNQHVQFFYELGLLGVILFWLLIIVFLIRGVMLVRLSNDPVSLMLKFMFLSVCFHLFDSFSHDGLFSTGNPASYLFWFKVGFVWQGYAVMRKNLVSSNQVSKFNYVSGATRY